MPDLFLGTYASDAAALAAVPVSWGTLNPGVYYVMTPSGNVRTWNGATFTGDMQDDVTPTEVIPAGTALNAATYVEQAAGIDCLNYTGVAYYITVTDKSTATKIRAQLLWSDSLAGTYGVQPLEGTPAAGVVIANDWSSDIDISGKIATFALHFPAPVAGAFVKLALKSDAGTPTVGPVTIMRQGT